MRKRRAARIFWLIVFISALFLYFFFQGYYPNVRLGLKRIFMENWGSNFTGSTDIFHPFGIINVRTTQTDATILLNDGYYGNNEKRVSDYGKYAMEISKDWYLTNNLIFIIDREKTFFIEKVSLIPRPAYRKLEGIEEIYSINDKTIISMNELELSLLSIPDPSDILGASIFWQILGLLYGKRVIWQKQVRISIILSRHVRMLCGSTMYFIVKKQRVCSRNEESIWQVLLISRITS